MTTDNLLDADIASGIQEQSQAAAELRRLRVFQRANAENYP
jgi:hypothetical protein